MNRLRIGKNRRITKRGVNELMDRLEFEAQIHRLHAFKKNIDMELIKAYWLALQYWSTADLEYCITRVLQDDTSFPKVPRLRQILRERNGRRDARSLQSVGPSFRFHCNSCASEFTVLLTQFESDKGFIWCSGYSKSICSRSWKTSELRDEMMIAMEHDEEMASV